MSELTVLQAMRLKGRIAEPQLVATLGEGASDVAQTVLQLTAAQDLATDEAVYLQVIRGKTAALFAAATESGMATQGRSTQCPR